MRPNELLFAEVSADRSMVRLTAKVPVYMIRFVGCSMHLATSARPGEVGNTFMFTGSKDRGGVAVLRVSHPDLETRFGEVETDLFIRFHPFNEKGERVDLKSEYVPTSAILAQVVSQKNNFGLRVFIDGRFYSNVQYDDQLFVRHVTEVNLLVSYVAGDVASDTVIAAAEAFHRSVIEHLAVKKDALVHRIAKLQGEMPNLEQIKADALEQSKVRHKKLIESGVSDAGIEYDSRMESLRAHYIDSATRIETKKCLISDFEAELRTVEERMLQLQDAFNATSKDVRSSVSAEAEIDKIQRRIARRLRDETPLIRVAPTKRRFGWVRRVFDRFMDRIDPPYVQPSRRQLRRETEIENPLEPFEDLVSASKEEMLVIASQMRANQTQQASRFVEAIAGIIALRDRARDDLQKMRDLYLGRGVLEEKLVSMPEYIERQSRLLELDQRVEKHMKNLRKMRTDLGSLEEDIEQMKLLDEIAELLRSGRRLS